MEGGADQTIHDVLVFGLTTLLCVYLLWALLSRMQGSRPGLALAAPIFLALLLRVGAAAGTSLTGVASFLRGSDELSFIGHASDISATTFGSEQWVDALTGALHEFVFAVQLGAFDSPDLALRLGQSTIAVVGILLLAVAVYELAGPRAALLTAWLLALEPSGIFFSSLLHKEALMMLASGLVAYGGAMLWRHASPRWLLPMTMGCLVAVATRPYAGWFLIAATAAITLHAGIRAPTDAPARRLSLIAVVLLLVAISVPTVLEASTDESLERNLQVSQNANASDESNLGLEQVDFSTRGAIVTNLPVRVREILTKPYPWQVDNISQQLAVVGSLIALVVFVMLVTTILKNRGQVMQRAGPLLYLTVALLFAYSLSVGNAGTAFRYRTHILTPAIAALVALRTRPEEEAVAEPLLGQGRGRPPLAAGSVG